MVTVEHFNATTDPLLYSCPCGCESVQPSDELLVTLELVRKYYGRAMIVTSGPRCAYYNTQVKGSKHSEHVDGKAADIKCCASRDRHDLIQAITDAGVTRYGIGPNFIHIGVSEIHSQDVVWTYSED